MVEGLGDWWCGRMGDTRKADMPSGQLAFATCSEFSVLRTRSYYQDLGQKFDGWVCIYLCGSSQSEFEKNGKRSFFLVLRICAYHFNPVSTKTGGGRKER